MYMLYIVDLESAVKPGHHIPAPWVVYGPAYQVIFFLEFFLF